MKELNFEVERLKISYSGESCELRLPSYDEEIMFLSKCEDEKLGPEEIVEVSKQYLMSLDMSESMFKKLPTKYLKEVLKSLSGNDEKK
jgi:hypothetical protein